MNAALALFAAATMLGGCAANQPQAYSAGDRHAMADAAATTGSSCFRMGQLRGHKRVDANTLNIEAGDGSVYRWEMSGSCLAGASSSDPLVMSPSGGSDLICKPIDLDLKIKSGSMLSPCIIKSFTKLTTAQVAALPPKFKP